MYEAEKPTSVLLTNVVEIYERSIHRLQFDTIVMFAGMPIFCPLIPIFSHYLKESTSILHCQNISFVIPLSYFLRKHVGKERFYQHNVLLV